MTTKETGGPEMSDDFSVIRERLIRAKAVRDLTRTRHQTADEKLLDALFGGKTTSIARSEFGVTPEQLDLLVEKINKVRSWVVDNGELVKEGIDPKFWLRKDETFEVLASVVGGAGSEEDEEDKLSFVNRNRQFSIYAVFGFSDDFDLTIEFFNEKNPGKMDAEYRSSSLPLEKMTDVEYKIINQCLDKYIDQVIQKPQT